MKTAIVNQNQLRIWHQRPGHKSLALLIPFPHQYVKTSQPPPTAGKNIHHSWIQEPVPILALPFTAMAEEILTSQNLNFFFCKMGRVKYLHFIELFEE